MEALQALHLGVAMVMKCEICGDVIQQAELHSCSKAKILEPLSRTGPGAVRRFSTGATRDVDEEKIDPEAFLDPLTLGKYFEFMHRHRKQKDGSLRDGDNWQKGFTRKSIMKSLWRHTFDVWLMHRGYAPRSLDAQQIYNESGARMAMIEALCGVLFNGFAYMREVVLGREVDS